MNLLQTLLNTSPLEAPCPVCRAPRNEPCTGNNGISHTARQLLRIAELEAARPAD